MSRTSTGPAGPRLSVSRATRSLTCRVSAPVARASRRLKRGLVSPRARPRGPHRAPRPVPRLCRRRFKPFGTRRLLKIAAGEKNIEWRFPVITGDLLRAGALAVEVSARPPRPVRAAAGVRERASADCARVSRGRCPSRAGIQGKSDASGTYRPGPRPASPRGSRSPRVRSPSRFHPFSRSVPAIAAPENALYSEPTSHWRVL